MLCSQAQRRLLRDYKKLTADAVDCIQAAPVRDDLFNWCAIIFGPAGSAFEGGLWKVDVAFPTEYPQKPPVMRFRNPMFHPNVSPTGDIFCEVLGAGWTPGHDANAIFKAVSGLLKSPELNLEGGANPEANSLYQADRTSFNARVKEIMDRQVAEDDANMGCLSAVP